MDRPAQLASALLDQRRFDQAIPILKRALAANPRDPQLTSLMGYACFATGNYPQAEFYSRQSVALMPANAQAHANLGSALVSQARFAEALTHLDRAITLDPRDDIAAAAHISCLLSLTRITDAVAAARAALAAFPNHPHILKSLASALHSAGRIDEALPLLARSVAQAPSPGSLQLWASMHNYAPNTPRERTLQAHQAFARALAPATPPRPPSTNHTPLRIGLLSPDLRRHSVADVIEPFIEHADRTKLFLACYSAASHEDATSARLKSKADLWRNIFTTPDPAAADLIRKDRIDILIDLAGLTSGQRLGILTLRPAPMQMTYAGYPNTTGLTCIDHRIVDAITDPPGAEPFSTEHLLRLPCSTIYNPPASAPAITPAPFTTTNRITFASFASLLKYNDQLINLWSRTLQAVPNSRLLLKHLALEDSTVRADLLTRFTAAGAPPNSVEALPPTKSHEDHLAIYAQVDIALDTFPYNGTVTILEAMHMGVPTISLAGDTTAARMGLSLLTAAGLPDLCTTTQDAYIQTAAALANNPTRLTTLRATLRQTLATSPLCDAPSFCRHLEAALIEAWQSRTIAR